MLRYGCYDYRVHSELTLGALRTVKTTGLPTISGLWFNNINQQTHISRRSHWGKNTGSHLNSEVKHSKAGLVLGWGTAWEPHGNDGFFFPLRFFSVPGAV